MPELPEVETIRLGLTKLIVGKTIKSVIFDWPKSFPNNAKDVDNFMIDSTISGVRRRAKVLIMDLSTDYSLLTHLKMTGQLVYRSKNLNFGAGHPGASLVGQLPDKSTRITITFTDNAKLYFNDQRKFGWMKLLPTIEIDSIDFFKKLGPEPLSADFSWLTLKHRLSRRPNSVVKAVLLDQSVIAGIGNIYADEALWGAKIHPATPAKLLSDFKLKKLQAEITYVLKLSIEKGGSSDRNYINAEGKKGSYLSFARVFRREGLPCPRCDHIIMKTRVAGRGTHYCPH